MPNITAHTKKIDRGNIRVVSVITIMFVLYMIMGLGRVSAVAGPAYFGTGSDGDLVVADGQIGFTDIYRSAVASSASSGQNQITLADGSSFQVSQEVFIMQMQGSSSGSYEFATITAVSGNTLTLQYNLANTYTVATKEKAQVTVVPQFQNVTVKSGGVLTVNGWDGATGGVLVFRASGVLTVEDGGTISVAGKGFRNFTRSSNVMARGGRNGEGTDWWNGTGGGIGTYGYNGGGTGTLLNSASPSGYRSAGGGGGLYNHPTSGQGDEGSGGGGGGGNRTAGGGGGGGGDANSLGGVGGATILSGNTGGGDGGRESGPGADAGSRAFGYTGTGGGSWSSPDRGSGGGGGGSASADSSDGSTMRLGAAGGQGGHYQGNNGEGTFYGAAGGFGGGVLFVQANQINCLGTSCMDASGVAGNSSTNRAGSGGGGAGGYIVARAVALSIGTDYLSVSGGAGGVGVQGASGDGGDGGYGRVRLEYCGSYSGSTSTQPSIQQIDCVAPTATPTSTSAPPTATLEPTSTPAPSATPVELQAPVAVPDTSWDADGRLELNGSLSYDPDGTIMSFSWQILGEASARSGEVISVSDLVAGDYSVDLRVVDNDGLSDMVTMQFSVVSDSADTEKPDVPHATLNENPAGSDDTVSGDAGSVEGSAKVSVYADADLTDLLGFTMANEDGSFDEIAVGDNAFEMVYVTATDQAGNVSHAQKLRNDIASPTIKRTSPIDGATGVRRNTNILVWFSEFMDEDATISAFSISGDVTGKLRMDGPRLMFNPDGKLAANTTYTVTISVLAMDESGNPITVEYVFSFTTGKK